MRLSTIFALMVILICTTAGSSQERTDYERLMSGEVVELEWGEPLTLEQVWTEDPVADNWPPAPTLLFRMVQGVVLEKDEATQEYFERYLLTQLMIYMSPEVIYDLPYSTYEGVAATKVWWDPASSTLFVQSGRYLPLENWPQGTCPLGGGLSERIYTRVYNCDGADENQGAYPLYTQYWRDDPNSEIPDYDSDQLVFTVLFYPPPE